MGTPSIEVGSATPVRRAKSIPTKRLLNKKVRLLARVNSGPHIPAVLPDTGMLECSSTKGTCRCQYASSGGQQLRLQCQQRTKQQGAPQEYRLEPVGGRELLEDQYFLRPPLPQLTFSSPPLPAARGAASVFAGFAADDVLPVPRAPRAHAVAAQTAHVRQRHQARSQQRRRMGNSMFWHLQTWLQEGDHLRFSTGQNSSMPVSRNICVT